MSSSEPLYSFHAFLFPFEWKFRKEEDTTFEKKTDLLRLNNIMAKNSQTWQRRETWLDPKAVVHYNEANFFYDFVHPAMYDTGLGKSLLSHYYRILPAPGKTEYVIELSNGKTYRLEVDDIVVNFYDSGVGVLAFHLYNKEKSQSAPEDILMINQFGRRLYPPFLGADNDLVGAQEFFEYDNWSKGLEEVKQFELAQSIRLEYGSQTLFIEDFSDWAIKPIFDREPGLVKQLLPDQLLKEIRLTPVIDDRMFVICWYGNDLLSKSLQEWPQLLSDKWWYRYVFVDGEGMTCQDPEMSKNLIKEHTNTRWMKYGTLYGVSRYSMVCLTEEMKPKSFSRVICSHMQTVYYKIALLCLVQRAGVVRFSDEVTAISQLPEEDSGIAKKVSSLYKQYLRFINKIYFREVTAQEQGIELYDLLQKHMRLGDHTKELEVEVRELNHYVVILEAERRNKKLDLITLIGAFLLGPSFIASFLGVNDRFLNGDGWWKILLMCVFAAVLAYGFIRTSGWRRTLSLILIGVLMLYLFIFVKMVVL